MPTTPSPCAPMDAIADGFPIRGHWFWGDAPVTVVGCGQGRVSLEHDDHHAGVKAVTDITVAHARRVLTAVPS